MIYYVKVDDLVKSRKIPFFVIPDFGELSRVAKAGIQSIQIVKKALDSGFHRSDDFLRSHQRFGLKSICGQKFIRPLGQGASTHYRFVF